MKIKNKSGLPAEARRAEAGQVSRLLLVLAIVVLVAVAIVYLVIKAAERPLIPSAGEPINTIPQPVYETNLGNIKFVFIDSRDLGSVLTPAMAKKQTYGTTNSLKTTERFIIVTVGAQNKGKENIEAKSWDIGDIVDSEGRRFVALKDYTINNWIPDESSCGALLKPEFDPTPCIKIYEVSKISSGLKIVVTAGKDKNNLQESLLDLIVR